MISDDDDDEITSALDDYPVPIAKRRKLSNDRGVEALHVLERPISPPLLRRHNEVKQFGPLPAKMNVLAVPSPVHLTQIHDLPQTHNIETVSLKDILGDPLVKQTWQFNFLFDIDFLMSAFDQDVRESVQVNIVHGFWKKDDPSRLNLMEAASRYPNVKLITAHMPEMYGTHHSKMMINLRHDDTAQVVIHTSNMIERDWTNLSQAAWISPLLPLAPDPGTAQKPGYGETSGVGECFKNDLIQYLRAYESRTTDLITEIERYDFHSVRAALVASVPGRHTKRTSSTASRQPSWGLQGLREILKKIPSSTPASQRSKVVVQISSIASLRPLDGWFEAFRSVLSTTSSAIDKPPIFRIIFPTADEVRRSLDGYAAGASIHTRIEGPAQQKQLNYLRQMLCYWAGDGERPMSAPHSSAADATLPRREAGRRRAAPHIKTYVRFADGEMTTIDWAMVTSANLSVQAWGALPDKEGKVRISSYEIGVVVWPGLFADMDAAAVDNDKNHPTRRSAATLHDLKPAQETPAITATSTSTSKPRNTPQGRTIMIPTFMANTPPPSQAFPADVSAVVGFRMPYDLPLTRYLSDEEPWCATSSHEEPDGKGKTWRVEGE